MSMVLGKSCSWFFNGLLTEPSPRDSAISHIARQMVEIIKKFNVYLATLYFLRTFASSKQYGMTMAFRRWKKTL